MKKLISIVLCAFLGLTAVACGGGGDDPNTPTGPRPIEIQIVTGADDGMGLDGYKNFEIRAERELKDVQYGDYVGVDIVNNFIDGSAGNFSSDNYHIYYDNGATLATGVALGAFQDITPLYSRVLGQRDGVDYTLEELVTENGSEKYRFVSLPATSNVETEFENGYKIAPLNGRRYYGVTGTETYIGLSYDRELWDEFGYYFIKPDAPEGVGMVMESDDFGTSYRIARTEAGGLDEDALAYLTPGPDGDETTEYDNGMPSSFFELISICDFMSTMDSVFPFNVSGVHSNYTNAMFDAMLQSLRGFEQAKADFNFRSTIDAVVGYTDEPVFPVTSDSPLYSIKKPIVKRVQITEDTGYYISWSIEKYFLAQLYQLINQKGWWGKAYTDTKDHINSQKDFLFSGYGGDYRVAMLSEWSYWQNESKVRSSYNQLFFANYGIIQTMDDRDVRWMPLPVNIYNQVTGEDVQASMPCLITGDGSVEITESLAGNEPTLTNTSGSISSCTAVNAYRVVPGTILYDAVLDVLALKYTPEAMEDCESMFYPWKFEMREGAASKFGLTVYEQMQRGNILYQQADSALYDRTFASYWKMGYGSCYWGNGAGDHCQSYFATKKVTNKNWMTKAHQNDVGEYGGTNASKLNSGVKLFEYQMIDYKTWQGVTTTAAITKDSNGANIEYMPCKNNGGY